MTACYDSTVQVDRKGISRRSEKHFHRCEFRNVRDPRLLVLSARTFIYHCVGKKREIEKIRL